LIWCSGHEELEKWAGRIEERGHERALKQADEGSAQMIRWFVANGGGDADLGWIVFTFPDRMLHAFGPRVSDFETDDKAKEMFKRRDALHVDMLELIWKLTKFLESELQPESTLIMSDHGFDHWGTSHTQNGLLAYRNLEPFASEGKANYDVARIVAEYFGHSWEPASPYTAPEQAAVEARLKALGYYG